MITWFKQVLHKVTNARNLVILKYKGVTFGRNFRMKGTLKVYGKGNNITIGDDFFGQSGIRYNPVGLGKPFVLQVINDGRISIGNKVGMSNCVLCAQDYIEIGDRTNIGGGTLIIDTDCHSLILEERISYPDPGIKHRPVKIGSGVFVGANSIILKGTTIGDRAVIGAGSVVSGNIPAGEIWVGNPAKKIKNVERV